MVDQPTSNRRTLTGVVTKLVGDGATYGFINDEIFFPQTNVLDGPASVGDQVYAECEYSAHMPIKWNAISVKVLARGSAQQQSSNNPPSNDRPMAAPMLNQQQPAVAPTYQQHRQQRQLRMMMDTQKIQDDNRPVDQLTTTGQAPVFNQQASVQQAQPQDSSIPPFQAPEQSPMGPPNFAFTSQLGSAFVQPNQFVPPPFAAQHHQPPPQTLLPQTQQQQSETHIHSGNQHLGQNNQRQHNQLNKGGRFDNRNNDKNDHNQANRRNKNDKFDRSRSNDRDNSLTRSKDPRNRDHGDTKNKRDNSSDSPLQGRSRSTTSSEKVIKTTWKRHYEIVNIPKSPIMTNMSPYSIKHRCHPASLHVPSDLKEIIVNRFFRLDIMNIPKPVKIVIEETQDKEVTSEIPEENPKSEAEKDQSNQSATSSDVTKPKDLMTPPSSKSDHKLNHKYCVKIVLLSLPEMEDIYKRVFGQNLDSYTSEGRPESKLDELISMICSKGTNNGYSLIGGKFDPVLDGFIEGEQNELERHGLKPDLIATCKRAAKESIGLDLGSCKNWTLLCTFIYNNKSDYFTSKASVEYSHIYMPHLWTMMNEEMDENLFNKESIYEVENPTEAKDVSQSELSEEQTAPADSAVAEPTLSEDNQLSSSDVEPTGSQSDVTTENLGELKVTDLKIELDKRGIKYKAGLKKADLVALLRSSLTSDEPQESVTESKVSAENDDNVEQCDSGNEVEVKPPMDDACEVKPQDNESADMSQTDESTGKRKVDEGESSTEESSAKKLCLDQPAKDGNDRVELIKKAFHVRSREGQQISAVSLYDSAQGGRHDQFELSIASNLLRESLTQHLSEYILTTLVENQCLSATSGTTTTTTSSPPNSDTNNNSTKQSAPPKSSTDQTAIVTKEQPVDRYITLAFSYFDSCHIGHIYAEDLNKLFNNTGLTISKRALTSLISGSDKFHYRTLQDLSHKLNPGHIYLFPKQFSQLSNSTTISRQTIEHQGAMYNVDELIKHFKEAETLRVRLAERFNHAIASSDKQAEEIHLLEVNQKSLAKAIKSQNDEICELKRERESLKKKLDALRKGVKSTIGTLNGLVKED